MSSTSAAADRIEPHDCARCYVDAVEAALAGVLRDVGPRLAEPRMVNLDRAVRVLDCFAETITGYALGAIARHLRTGLKQWLGDAGLAVMRGALHGWPAPAPRVAVTAHDPARPLAGELCAQLHARFCHAVGQARSLAHAVPARPMTGLMFGALAKDDVLRVRIGDELARGWRVYTAAVTTRRYAELTALWRDWVWQLDGRPVLTRDATTEAGYIMLVR